MLTVSLIYTETTKKVTLLGVFFLQKINNWVLIKL
jgi:hypothetical protein